MKLYSGPLSLFTAKIRIALDEKGLAYEKLDVGWSREDRYLPHHPDVVALNPKAQVPVLVDGDVVVYDSTLIFEYLEEAYPDPPLYPSDLATRTRCRRLEAEADELIFPFVWDLIEEVFYPADPSDRDPERRTRATDELACLFGGLEKQLAGPGTVGGYLCGGFSVADIASFVMLSAAATLGVSPDSGHPHLQEWLARVGGRPPVAREVAQLNAAAAAAMAG